MMMITSKCSFLKFLFLVVIRYRRFVKNGKWKDDIYFLNQEHLKSRPLSSTQRGLNVCQSTLERFRHAKTLLSDALPMQRKLAINLQPNSKNKVIEELQSNLRKCSRYSSKVEVEGSRESDQLVSSRKSKSAG